MSLSAFIIALIWIVPTTDGSFSINNNESTQTISEEERTKSIKLLQGSLDKLTELTENLNEEQLNFRPADNRWSIIDNINHLIKVEGVVWSIIENTLKEPGDGQKSDISDDDFIRKMSTREKSFNAPAKLQPSEDDFTDYRSAMAEFKKVRKRTIDFVKKNDEDLRGHFSPNPVFGNLDTYQWTLHPSTHCYRHIEQIEEIIADSNFPK